MIAIILIALAAGCASALMFASIISGALISLLLFYLAPLPLMVAALGWGPLAATIGGIAAASASARSSACPIASPLPSRSRCPPGGSAISRCWAGRWPMPARAMAPRRPPPALEWYPVGRILLWIAGFAVLTTIAALLTLGTDAETITGSLRRGLLRILGPRDAAASGDAERWVDALVDHRAGRGRDRRHDDADAQPLARRKDHRDLGTAASALARPEERGVAADDAGGVVASRSHSASPAGLSRLFAQIVDARR